MSEKYSDFGCIRFHNSQFSRLATEAGNQGCMASDGKILDNAFAASSRTTEAYLMAVADGFGGKVSAEFYILSRQLMQLTLLHALYVSAGRQVFQFTPKILADFKRTDLSETPIGKLTLPYHAGFIHLGLQEDLALDEWWRTEAEFVDGAYFHCGPEGQLTIQLTLSRPGGNWSKLPGPSFSIPQTNLNLPAHEAIDKALDADIAETEDNRFKDELHNTVQEWDASTRPVVHAALSLVLNALFYLDGYGADTEPVVPDEAPQIARETYEKAVKSGKPKVIRNARNALMADGFSVVRLCGVAADDSTATDDAGTSGHTVRTHWRRGHWRMQPCGAKLSNVKRVWVRPTLVGRDSGGAIKGHVYLVNEPRA